MHYTNASKTISFQSKSVDKNANFAVYDLLVSPDCLPDLLQGGIKAKNMNNVFILASLKVQNKAPTRAFRIFNAMDNTDYFDFSIQGKQNKVVLKYLKSNGKVGTTSFAKVPLTDGKEHYILLHFSGLQKGTPTTTLYVDCKLVERVQDVPQAFKSLPQGPKRITLKTLSTSNQDCNGPENSEHRDHRAQSEQMETLQLLGTTSKMEAGPMFELMRMIQDLKQKVDQQVT
ncbi:Thrombospondin-4-B [Labeo rohita]|uniref:Thrombospondin-4-B n=1 Tax=Labeo rohita TaxID=84645 RepID=A0ABQ8MNH8_LABRO|nr:Thrombospondin-4-B [Labeo rohita]